MTKFLVTPFLMLPAMFARLVAAGEIAPGKTAPEWDVEGVTWINSEAPIALTKLRGKKRVLLWFSSVF